MNTLQPTVEKLLAYLHFVGFRHKDLFALEEYHRVEWDKYVRLPDIRAEDLHELAVKAACTEERRSGIDACSRENPFGVFLLRIRRLPIRILLHTHPEFPESLREMKNPPFILYVMGSLENRTSSVGSVCAADKEMMDKAVASGDKASIRIAIVGSREATTYGEQVV